MDLDGLKSPQDGDHILFPWYFVFCFCIYLPHHHYHHIGRQTLGYNIGFPWVFRCFQMYTIIQSPRPMSWPHTSHCWALHGPSWCSARDFHRSTAIFLTLALLRSRQSRVRPVPQNHWFSSLVLRRGLHCDGSDRWTWQLSRAAELSRGRSIVCQSGGSSVQNLDARGTDGQEMDTSQEHRTLGMREFAFIG